MPRHPDTPRRPLPARPDDAVPAVGASHRGTFARRARRSLGSAALGLCGLTTLAPQGVAQDGAAARGVAAPGAAAARRDETVVRVAERDGVELIRTFSKRLKLANGLRIAAVDGFDEQVVQVDPVDSTTVRLFAKNPGVTTLTLTDERNRVHAVQLLVTGDARHLQAVLDDLYADAAVTVHPLNEQNVVLRGWVTRPEQVSQVLAVAAQFYPPESILNEMRVTTPQQVQLSVKIMEVQRSKVEQLGFNFGSFGADGFAASLPGALSPVDDFGVGAGGGVLDFAAAAINNSSLTFGIAGGDKSALLFLDALRQERLLKVLAEPKQTATNGRPAYFTAGGEFPVPIPQGLGATGIEFRRFGVQLTVVPVMLGEGRLRLEIDTSVSDLDFARSVSIQGTTVPGLTNRQSNTAVELGFGETLMIAGLITNNQVGTASKIPFLGELPLVGAAFRRVKYEENETELVILVTPHPVAALPPGHVPPGGPGQTTDRPTTRELFGLGLLEVPKVGERCDPCVTPPPAAFGAPSYGAPGYGAPGYGPPAAFGPPAAAPQYSPGPTPGPGMYTPGGFDGGPADVPPAPAPGPPFEAAPGGGVPLTGAARRGRVAPAGGTSAAAGGVTPAGYAAPTPAPPKRTAKSPGGFAAKVWPFSKLRADDGHE